MSYESLNEYVRYLQSFPRTRPREVLNLDRLRSLLDVIGHPEEGMRGIHVGGTNGKGSTTAIAEQILRDAGYTTGSYYSPHLLSYTERIQVNGEPIPESDFIRIIEGLQPVVENVEKEIHDRLTWFELLSVVAIIYFRERNVNAVVWEVGVGGTFDPGNLLPLDVKVITNVQRDHLKLLGPTLEHVASEKAGIITAPCQRVFTAAEGRPLDILARRAHRLGAAFLPVNEADDVEVVEISLNGTLMHYDDLLNAKLQLIGSHFAVNAALAYRATCAFDEHIARETIHRSLTQAVLPGRFQVIQGQPPIIMDVAHNPDGIERVVETLNDLGVPRNSLAVIYASRPRKNVVEILKVLSPRARALFFPPLQGFVQPAALLRIIENGEAAPSLQRALRSARSLVGNEGVVLITGSCFLIGEFLALLNGVKRNALDRIDDNLAEHLLHPLRHLPSVV